MVDVTSTTTGALPDSNEAGFDLVSRHLSAAKVEGVPEPRPQDRAGPPRGRADLGPRGPRLHQLPQLGRRVQLRPPPRVRRRGAHGGGRRARHGRLAAAVGAARAGRARALARTPARLAALHVLHRVGRRGGRGGVQARALGHRPRRDRVRRARLPRPRRLLAGDGRAAAVASASGRSTPGIARVPFGDIAAVERAVERRDGGGDHGDDPGDRRLPRAARRLLRARSRRSATSAARC